MKEDQNQQWEQKLSPESYAVLRQGGTEPAFTSNLNHNKEKGVYICGACGAPLFGSDEKFDSGTGWPSFTDPIENAVEFKDDTKFGMRRVEVRCGTCHSHLGHVFPDGPGTSGQRFCINGLALNFDTKEPESDI